MRRALPLLHGRSCSICPTPCIVNEPAVQWQLRFDTMASILRYGTGTLRLAIRCSWPLSATWCHKRVQAEIMIHAETMVTLESWL